MRIRWTSPALSDLSDIQDYVAQHSPSAAHRLIEEILARSREALTSNPFMGRPGQIAGTREFVLTGTAYLLIYRVLHEDVEVLALVHAARDWKRQVPPPPQS